MMNFINSPITLTLANLDAVVRDEFEEVGPIEFNAKIRSDGNTLNLVGVQAIFNANGKQHSFPIQDYNLCGFTFAEKLRHDIRQISG